MNYNYMLYKKSGRRQPTILLPKEMVKYRRAKSVCLRILLHIRYTVYPVGKIRGCWSVAESGCGTGGL